MATTTTTTLHNVDLRNHHLEKDPCIINTVSFHSDDTSSSDIDDESQQLQKPHHEKPDSKHYEFITHDHHDHHDQDYHPLRKQITSQTNDFILTHWSFSSSSATSSSSSSSSSSFSAPSYLKTDLPGLASKIFPFALNDRIHLLARLFSVVFLLGEEIDSLVNHHDENDDERDDENDDDDERDEGDRDAEREGVRKEIIQFLKESFNGVYGRRREEKIDREEEEEEEEEFPLVWMLNHVLDEMASHAYLLVMGEVQEAIWRFLGIARRSQRKEHFSDSMDEDDEDDALSRFRAKFVDAGMWLPLYRFATGGMVDEEEFGFGGVEMVDWSGVDGRGS
ncbi:hypothetical protein SMMN14_02244 [Sphaerulina musiva]